MISSIRAGVLEGREWNFGSIDNDPATGNAFPLLPHNAANQTSPATFRVDSISTILYLYYRSEREGCAEK